MKPIVDHLLKLGAEFGWIQIDHQENIMMLSFSNGPTRMNVYYSRMTVATVLDHPKLGRNTLYRRRVTFSELRDLFKNPRKHTGTGYHRKKAAAS